LFTGEHDEADAPTTRRATSWASSTATWTGSWRPTSAGSGPASGRTPPPDPFAEGRAWYRPWAGRADPVSEAPGCA
jgi:hypothetical protein